MANETAQAPDFARDARQAAPCGNGESRAAEVSAVAEDAVRRISINAHSSIRLALDGGALYVDPFRIGGQSAPIGCGDAAVIFFTHSHFDHFSPNDFESLVNEDTVFVMPSSMVDKALADTPLVTAERVVALGPGQRAEVACAGEQVVVEAVAAYNVGKKFHPRKNNWLGYVLEVAGTRYYIMGDTDDVPEARATECDVLLIPVGGTYTMDAAEAAAFVGGMATAPAVLIPTHYGPIAGSPEDGQRFAALMQQDGEGRISWRPVLDGGDSWLQAVDSSNPQARKVIAAK